MPAEFASLLPSHAGAFMRAVEQASGERWPQVDVDVIRRYRDPYRCPEHLLHDLARERSVDVWDPSWPVKIQRWVIAEWPRLQRKKGTLAGLRSFASLTGATVTRVVVPPAKTFLGRTRTEAERQAFLSRFPQLRIYPFVEGWRHKDGPFLYEGRATKGKRFLGSLYPRDLAASQRYRRDAKLYEPRDGSLVDLTRREVETVGFQGLEATSFEEFTLPSIRSRKIFLGSRPKTRLFFGRGGVPSRIISIRSSRRYGYELGKTVFKTVTPSLTPISVEPELVTEIGKARPGQLFPGTRGRHRFLSKKYLPPSTAWQRIYERFYLFDPARLPTGRGRAGTFLGRTRLGLAPHHAVATVEIPTKRPHRAVRRFVSGFLHSGDRSKVERTREAMDAARRLSDVVTINTKTRRTLRAGDPIVEGVTTIGGIVRA